MPNHFIITGLGYGDEGKGSVTEWLCAREPVHTVVRFNGGAQAGHNVVTRDGRHHVFSQFGSGTLRGVRTHLSRFVLADPLALAGEAVHLAELGVADPFSMLTADGQALLVTPYHQAANQARERARGSGRHGSCGKGIGETVSFALSNPELAPRVCDCRNPGILAGLLGKTCALLENELGRFGNVPSPLDLADAYSAFGKRVRITGDDYLPGILRNHTVVFEGAQGVMLDQQFGYQPYTTWSKTTYANAQTLMREAGVSDCFRIGVTRCYATRHGAGPFITEDKSLMLPDPHNTSDEWQGDFRVGHLDAVSLRYALAVSGGADGIALTHVDTAAANPDLQICQSYSYDGKLMRNLPMAQGYARHVQPVYFPQERDWAQAVQEAAGVPVRIVSHGPGADAKSWLRERDEVFGFRPVLR
jgi:adenylosuccinate synthase